MTRVKSIRIICTFEHRPEGFPPQPDTVDEYTVNYPAPDDPLLKAVVDAAPKPEYVDLFA